MVSVAVVGAGFSGLCMAIKLKEAGIQDSTIFEAADDIGGTWWQNKYPGCACDVPSICYCYSFEPYPWSKHFSDQPEILAYLHRCAGKRPAAAVQTGSLAWAFLPVVGCQHAA
jgi:cyclohexanone monooxygenase